jgi:hypothetical protein
MAPRKRLQVAHEVEVDNKLFSNDTINLMGLTLEANFRGFHLISFVKLLEKTSTFKSLNCLLPICMPPLLNTC